MPRDVLKKHNSNFMFSFPLWILRKLGEVKAIVQKTLKKSHTTHQTKPKKFQPQEPNIMIKNLAGVFLFLGSLSPTGRAGPISTLFF